MKAGIVVIAEISVAGLTPASREVISFAGLLAESAGESILLMVPGYFPDIHKPSCHSASASKQENPPGSKGELGGFSYKEAEEIAMAAGCDVAVLAGDHLSAYSAEAWMDALSPVCREINPRFICIPHTSRGWDYGPGLAIRLEASLIGAVEGFRLDTGNFFFKRSFLKGQWQMEVLPETWPVILTILPEAKGTEAAAPLAAARSAGGRGRQPRISFLSVPAKDLRTKTLGRLPAPETAYDFSEAEVIVAAGKGIGTADNIDLIKRLAGVFPKSAVGCSRAICDPGWMEHRRQIGMTGRTVAPPLYIACGISGAMPHLAGMRNSRFIIAVNRDKNAAIFQVAHLGVVEDLSTFIPAVLELMENKKQESSDD
ncbi:MAG: FAD-binding protein [Syntrophales bacterium]|jgi:electron transfer flavoprotein alpha subunit|nr:FAD-binding protein [Syntrophales bacterium]MCK9391203.1 FAD-binding protein [Syntrophales bacterium]